MARLDDDELNIDPLLAAYLRGHAPARPRRPAAAPAPAPAAPRRTGGDVEATIGWIVTGLLGIFGSFLVLTVICFVIVLFTSHKPSATAVEISTRPQITNQSPRRLASHRTRSPYQPLSNRRALPVSQPAAQPQSPAVVETTDLEIDSRRTSQSPRQSESVPKSVGASPASFEWVCAEGKMLCGLQDPNGKYIQSFSLENGELHGSGINPNAVLPRSWSCETKEPKNKMYCTIQDGNGQFLQGVLYDGKVMKVFKNGGQCIRGCS